MSILQISTSSKRQVIDITNQVTNLMTGHDSGLIHLFLMHTTAALTTADLDPGTDLDLLDFLTAITPDIKWRHPHNPEHAPAHLLASIIGPGVNVPFADGQLQLGTWQRVILIELDGPSERRITVNFEKQ